MAIPKKYTDLIGTKQSFGGGLFSGKKELPYQEYNVLDCRWGTGTIIDLKTMKSKHPTIQFLIKKEGMRASRWTRSFAVREILLEDEED